MEQYSQIIDKLTSNHVFWLILVFFIYKIISDIARGTYKRRTDRRYKIKANLQIYDELSKRMFSKIKDNARSFCRKNGFDRLPHGKFKEKIKEFASECMTLGLQVMEEHYDNDVMIVPFHTARANYDETEVFLDTLDIMDSVRDISLKAKDKMCDLEKERIRRQEELDGSDTNQIVNLVIQYVTEVMEVKNSILRDQMNLIERKLELMRIKIYVSYRDRISGRKAAPDNPTRWMSFKDVVR